jgi:hypothetical protein
LNVTISIATLKKEQYDPSKTFIYFYQTIRCHLAAYNDLENSTVSALICDSPSPHRPCQSIEDPCVFICPSLSFLPFQLQRHVLIATRPAAVDTAFFTCDACCHTEPSICTAHAHAPCLRNVPALFQMRTFCLRLQVEPNTVRRKLAQCQHVLQSRPEESVENIFGPLRLHFEQVLLYILHLYLKTLYLIIK